MQLKEDCYFISNIRGAISW